MIGIIGIVIIFVMVFGGYVAAGGKLAIILKSLPFEFMMIGGAAIGAFVISNDVSTVKRTAVDLLRVFRGVKWKPDDYRDLLCLLYALIRIARQNPVALEEHIESPSDSSIFAVYPNIASDREAVELICDTMRAASLSFDDPHQVEEVLDKRIQSNLEHHNHTTHALQTMADGLPALGIVAAVLGVIKTMGSIDKPPEVLGKMIGGALVGTFLGVFLAYGLVGPFAARLKAIHDEDAHFYHIIREVLIANLHNHSVNVCMEIGRQNVPSHLRLTFSEVETALKDAKQVT